MYKLFLTFRYLTRKKIVIFPILVVWLCVMMLIIVTSIMQGFVDRVQDSNHELYGDIIISSPHSPLGFSGYQDMSNQIQAKFPGQVAAITPTVETWALMYVADAHQSLPALIVGVRPEERARVTQFRQSLFRQYQAPQEVLDLLSPRLPANQKQLGDYALDQWQQRAKESQAADMEYLRLDNTTRVPPIRLNWMWALGLPVLLGLVLLELRCRCGWWFLAGAIVSPILLTLPTLAVSETASYDALHWAQAFQLHWIQTATVLQIALLGFLGWRILSSSRATLAKALVLPIFPALAATFVAAAIMMLGADPARAHWGWALEACSSGGLVALMTLRTDHRLRARFLSASLLAVAGLVIISAGIFWFAAFRTQQYKVAQDTSHQADVATSLASRAYHSVLALPSDITFRDRAQLAAYLVPSNISFDVHPEPGSILPDGPLPADGIIVGSQMGFNSRDTRGNFVHPYPDPNYKVSITVFPPSANGNVNINATNAVTQDFTVVDDSHSGVFDVDQMNVYADFDTVQLMVGMRPDPRYKDDPKYKDNPNVNFAPRANELLIRLKPGAEGDLPLVRAQIEDFLLKNFPESQGLLVVQTWDEKQAKYLGAVENEKTMMTFILLLMSVVVLVVIFLIFYQIVRDKTRDIGIIKAVGGSELGVAGIYLIYGLMIGIVGGGLGAFSGAIFVTHTNAIHELIFHYTGIIIWDRSVYMFDRIPNVVHTSDIILYFVVALVAGVLGATIPAIFAAVEDPVKAVRYE